MALLLPHTFAWLLGTYMSLADQRHSKRKTKHLNKLLVYLW